MSKKQSATQKKQPKKKSVKKKKTTIKRHLPSVVSLVACEAVLTDPTSDKITLYGIIKKIKLKNINKSVNRICVYARLNGGIGKYDISFCIKLPNEDASPAGVTEIRFSENSIIDGYAVLENVGFPQPGIYHICVLADGKVIGNPCPLPVEIIENKDK